MPIHVSDCLIVLLWSALVWFYFRKDNPLPLPPGPPRIPVWGSLYGRRPTYTSALEYGELSKKIGSDIIHVREFGRDTVILSSPTAVRELMGDRSKIYSGRPPYFENLRRFGGWEWAFSHMPNDEPWRLRRQAFHDALPPSATPRLESEMTRNTLEMLTKIIDKPEDTFVQFFEASGDLMMEIAYGIPHLPAPASHFEALSSMHHIMVWQTSRTWDYVCMVLKWDIFNLPEWLVPFKRTARLRAEKVREMIHVPYNESKRQILQGSANSSYVIDSLSTDNGSNEKHDSLVRDTAAGLYIGGIHSSSLTLQALVMALYWFPEVQSKAQNEVDRVVGYGNIPTFGDFAGLTYIQAMVLEMMRWRPTTSYGSDHVVEVDDEYRGYHIPAGTAILTNLRAILHDPAVFSDPHVFRPERFLTVDGKINPDILDPRQLVFGYGRRLCPGRDFAMSSLFIKFACIVATLIVRPAIAMDPGSKTDQHRQIMEFLDPNSIYVPKDARIAIYPRSRDISQTVKASARAN
ncbi:cytochrome P450 [Athelia psychrophila]|uniref:Cytochrome P450 n=1 Tax=Athelia psychrophila TaxID=1759441 RepID=A0A166SUR0_9AGAM|nr:cytochrome P450 [Fibularhizoctonia sp. CBS 109695]